MAALIGGNGGHDDEPENRYVVVQPPNIIGIENDRDRSIRDYVIFDPETMNTGIVRPKITANHFEFKPMMFQMLQTVGQFSGLPHEDPHLHLKQFLEVASNFKIPGVSDDAFRLRLFPYSLKDRAKVWLNSLEPNSVTSWNGLAEKFITKYFPPTKNARMRNDITSFRQTDDESLFEAWERFKDLLRRCPHHGIPICIQMETFYNGLLPPTRLMLDASAGGALLNKSYAEAYELIESIAANSYQWPTSRINSTKNVAGVHELGDVSALTAQIASLTNMLKAVSTSNVVSPASMSSPVSSISLVVIEPSSSSVETVSCVFCGGGHIYDDCPNNPVSVNYVGNYNAGNYNSGNYNRGNNPYSNTYNLGWRQHPNFSWSNQTGQKNQVGQLATALSSRPSGALPSNTESPHRDGKEHAKAITLRSGNTVEVPEARKRAQKESDLVQDEVITEQEKNQQENIEVENSAEKSDANASVEPQQTLQHRPPPPFPQRFQKQQQDKKFQKFLDVLKQLHINIPFVEALEQMPNYVKFMKDMLMKKRRFGEFETVALTRECSAAFQSKLPPKLQDPGSFTIPCSIGGQYCGKALCDLGASINLMPM
ncbi:hypothetical protein UlMin_026318 [Ulmus minor]